MPSSLHEALVQMLRQRASPAAELLVNGLGMELPRYDQAELQPGDLTDLTSTAYRADAVVVLSTAGTAVLAMVVEVQLHRDPGKRWS